MGNEITDKYILKKLNERKTRKNEKDGCCW